MNYLPFILEEMANLQSVHRAFGDRKRFINAAKKMKYSNSHIKKNKDERLRVKNERRSVHGLPPLKSYAQV